MRRTHIRGGFRVLEVPEEVFMQKMSLADGCSEGKQRENAEYLQDAQRIAD